MDGVLVGTDTSAPYGLTWSVPKSLAYGSHLVEARAVDAASGTAVDSASVLRSKKSKLTLSVRGSTATGYSATGGSRAASGVVGGANEGTVVVSVQRRMGDHWVTKATQRATVNEAGAYSISLGRQPRGRWRARAQYIGTEQSPPSAPEMRKFRVA